MLYGGVVTPHDCVGDVIGRCCFGYMLLGRENLMLVNDGNSIVLLGLRHHRGLRIRFLYCRYVRYLWPMDGYIVRLSVRCDDVFVLLGHGVMRSIPSWRPKR